MSNTITAATLAALVLISAGGPLASYGIAQSAPVGCTGDFNCSEPKASSWPLDRGATYLGENLRLIISK
jgi:hypothetical protein